MLPGRVCLRKVVTILSFESLRLRGVRRERLPTRSPVPTTNLLLSMDERKGLAAPAREHGRCAPFDRVRARLHYSPLEHPSHPPIAVLDTRYWLHRCRSHY